MSDLTELVAIMAQIEEGRGLLVRRDELIRQALAAGTPYKELSAATGLSRPMLDKIRRSDKT